MTHAEQIKARIEYIKQGASWKDMGWVFDSLTLAVETMDFYATCKGDLDSDFENDFSGKLARESLAKISHGHLESSAFRPEGQ